MGGGGGRGKDSFRQVDVNSEHVGGSWASTRVCGPRCRVAGAHTAVGIEQFLAVPDGHLVQNATAALEAGHHLGQEMRRPGRA